MLLIKHFWCFLFLSEINISASHLVHRFNGMCISQSAEISNAAHYKLQLMYIEGF